MKLLVVDDDPKFRSYMRRGLEECDIDCSVAENSDVALELIGSDAPAPFDLVLLDVMLPTDSGWEVLEQMRARGIDVPVIFLTARHSVNERLKGFDLGADDYVIKPFAFAELLARIQAVVRRRLSLPVFEIEDLSIDLGARVVHAAGRRVDLSPREFELLHVLAMDRGVTFSRDELLKRVWDMDFDPGTNVVEVLVRRVRAKIGSERIETVAGQGYRLAVP